MTEDRGADEAAPPRSVLFYPGHRGEMLDKALGSGADAVCLDLEDAVPGAAKRQARAAAREALERVEGGGIPVPADGDHGERRQGAAGTPGGAGRRVELLVRVNSPDGEAGRRDLRALERAPGRPAAVVVPGAESPARLDRVAARASAPVVALVETPRGVEAAPEIGRETGSLRALALGPVDLSRHLGCALSWEPLLYARSRLVHAAALGGVPALDGPFTDLCDPDGLAAEARASRGLGFAGKLVLHPRQVGLVNRAFTPDEEEVAEAREVVSAWEESGGEAVRVDGRMVDRPVVEAARRVLFRAERSRRRAAGDPPGSPAEPGRPAGSGDDAGGGASPGG